MACLCLFLTSPTSYAALIFTDRTIWESAVYDLATDTFSNEISQDLSITLDSGVASSASQLIGSSNRVIGGFFSGFVNQTNCCDLTWDWSSLGGRSAFGVDVFRLNIPDGLVVTGDFDGQGEETISVVQAIGAEAGFFGLIGFSVFDSLVWSSNNGSGTNSGEGFSVDNFSLANRIPAPPTLALFGLGILGLGWSRSGKS